jgi:Putative Ig domain
MTRPRLQTHLALLPIAAVLLAACGDGGSSNSVATPASAGQSNTAPVISGTPGSAATAGQPYSFTPSASDVDGDALTFFVTNAPPWSSFSTATGQLNGTPTAAGTFSNIVIGVTDGQAAMALAAFSITVSAPSGGGTSNTAPTISGNPSTTATAGVAYSFRPTASDADGDPLTFSIVGKPGWANFSTTSGRLSGTPSSANVGAFNNIVIRVSDGQATTSLAAFSITVSAAGGTTNRPPTISGAPSTTVLQGSGYAFTPTASDPDGDTLTFSVTNPPGWATFNTSTGRLSGTPGAGDVGSYANISISVSDGQANATLGPFAINVVAVATGSATLSWAAPTTNTDGSALTDLAGFKVYWGTASGNYTNSVTLNGTGTLTYVVTNLTPATWYFSATAFNSKNVESTFSGEASKVIQ